MDEGLLAFWRVLNKHNVAYIMVGGFAMNMHGYSRTTNDSDLWLKDEPVNRYNLRLAFSELGYGDYPSLETMQFLPGWTQFYTKDGLIITILTSLKGLETQTFEDCYEKALIAGFNEIHVPFLHLNDPLRKQKGSGPFQGPNRRH